MNWLGEIGGIIGLDGNDDMEWLGGIGSGIWLGGNGGGCWLDENGCGSWLERNGSGAGWLDMAAEGWQAVDRLLVDDV